MKVWKVKQGEMIAKRQDKVMEWYLIQEGSVAQRIASEEIILERNSVVGILANEWFLCDYEAVEDTTLIVIPCKNADELQTILAEHPDFRAVFLRAALEQKFKVLRLYSELQGRTGLLHSFAESAYNDYKAMCQELFIEEQPFPRMESFEPLSMTHKAERWEIDSGDSLMRKHLKEYLVLMIKDEALCVGAIMETAAQVRRVTQGIGEMENYLQYNKDVLWSKSGNDLFHLFFDLAVQQAKRKKDIKTIQKEMERGYGVMQKLEVFDVETLAACHNKFKNYDFESASKGRLNVATEDCVRVILDYAGYDADGIQETKDLLTEFWKLPDRQSTDSDVFQMRKKICRMFYDVYEKAFFRSVDEGGNVSPILMMFFNYGFLDGQMLEEETINALYNLTENLKMFRADNIFTMYEWLLAIYRGEKEPSQNEFDMDFNGYLLEERKNGNMTVKQVEECKTNTRMKVHFEIENMFQSAHRITYGRVSTFVPVLCQDDFIQGVERMALTAEKLMQAVNAVREVDYSVLFREVMYSDAEHGIPQEWIMKEVLPDMILMPCCGTKGSMWQETSGVKTDTPARFMFPMFFGGDLDELMVELMGRYRWEICRRVQGVYWNDIRERSLTAEYCDYLQFYRKNNELSGEVKEKIKKTLQRSRNSYREVFVKDYQNWMKYEAKGSFRLNKVARNILIQYCAFSKPIRQNLKSNPVYQNAFTKLDNDNKRKESRLTSMYEKYEAAGGIVGPDLKENLRFCEM
jgi:hypothetical protein